MKAAAKHSSLQCMQYAHDHGCPWYSDPLITLNITGDRCFLYARYHGAPCNAAAAARAEALAAKRQALAYSFAFASQHSSDFTMTRSVSQSNAWGCMSMFEPELVKLIAQMAEWCF